MPLAPIKGTEGEIKIGPTVSAKSVQWVGKYEVELENQTEEVGPHIGDSNIYEVETGQKGSFKVNGTIPEGGDLGQNDLIDAVVSRLRPQIKFKTTKAKILTFASPTYKKLSFGVDAKGTPTFAAEGSGPFTVAQDPVV